MVGRRTAESTRGFGRRGEAWAGLVVEMVVATAGRTEPASLACTASALPAWLVRIRVTIIQKAPHARPGKQKGFRTTTLVWLGATTHGLEHYPVEGRPPTAAWCPHQRCTGPRGPSSLATPSEPLGTWSSSSTRHGSRCRRKAPASGPHGHWQGHPPCRPGPAASSSCYTWSSGGPEVT